MNDYLNYKLTLDYIYNSSNDISSLIIARGEVDEVSKSNIEKDYSLTLNCENKIFSVGEKCDYSLSKELEYTFKIFPKREINISFSILIK